MLKVGTIGLCRNIITWLHFGFLAIFMKTLKKEREKAGQHIQIFP